MNNSKRNVHTSGPLGILVKNGQVKKIDTDSSTPNNEATQFSKRIDPAASSYFKTSSGIEFAQDELVYVDPKECKPWKYANRHDSEMGDIDGLVESIKENKQLQPALVRHCVDTENGIKYEIIFGRRRHLACLKLGVPFLVICKDIPNEQDAIASQDAENKLRDDVSNYSNAILYKRLIEDSVFKTEKDLAKKLQISTSTLNELMAFTKIPADLISEIPDIHRLSKSLALKIVSLLKESPQTHQALRSVARKIGGTITSPVKLENEIQKLSNSHVTKTEAMVTKTYETSVGKRIFTFKLNFRGEPSFVFDKGMIAQVDFVEFSKHIQSYLEERYLKSGAPD